MLLYIIHVQECEYLLVHSQEWSFNHNAARFFLFFLSFLDFFVVVVFYCFQFMFLLIGVYFQVLERLQSN